MTKKISASELLITLRTYNNTREAAEKKTLNAACGQPEAAEKKTLNAACGQPERLT
jgi:hypothetical protein